MGKKYFSGTPKNQWSEFEAPGFQNKVPGVVLNRDKVPCCGVAVGGVATGAIDIDSRGVYGLSHIYNPAHWAIRHTRFSIARRINSMQPMLGIATGGQTWVLADKDIVAGGDFKVCTDVMCEASTKFSHHYDDRDSFEDVVPVPPIPGVLAADDIHYWGHFPVADMEFAASCPVEVALRVWSPFIPGDAVSSNIPAMVFEARLHNPTAQTHKGVLAFNFQGPDASEAGSGEFVRREIKEDFHGVLVEALGNNVQYVAGVLGGTARFGGSLAPDERNFPELLSWKDIGETLPPFSEFDRGGRMVSRDPDSSVAVDFCLEPGAETTVRFFGAWYAPNVIGGTQKHITEAERLDPSFLINRIEWFASPYDERNSWTHMYASRFASARDVAREIAERHEELLARVLGWQAALYADNDTPAWLKDSLVNNLSLFAEDGYWFMPRRPFGDWAFPGGVYAMNESPRGCPHFACIPCDWYGTMPLNFFFPELQRSTLRGFQQYQLDTGEIPFALGRITDLPDMAQPEYHWQCSLNSMCFIDMVDRLWRTTHDDTVLTEFYEAVKRANTYTMNLRTGYGTVIGMPDEGGMEWFEHGKWAGMATHMGGLRLAELRMVERMAQTMGDDAYVKECQAWFAEGSRCMEDDMWAGDYYLNFWDKETGEKSEEVMAFMLDGEWTARVHNLPGVFRPERVPVTLDTILRCNASLTPDCGAANFCKHDGGGLETDSKGGIGALDNRDDIAFYGSTAMFFPELSILAMNFIQDGRREFGLEFLRKAFQVVAIDHAHLFDLPNIIDGITGERTFGTDYYQNMMLWSVPVTLQGGLDTVLDEGGFVNRILEAGKKR